MSEEKSDNKFIIEIARIVDKEKGAKASILIHKIFDGLYKEVPQAIECEKGCNYCCRGSVSVTETEMKEVGMYIRKTFSKEELESVKKAATKIKKSLQELTKEERIYARHDCPLLMDGECSIYESRPLMCRSAYSYSKESCLVADSDSTMPVPMEAGTKAMSDEMTVGILLGERKREYQMNLVQGLQKEFKWN